MGNATPPGADTPAATSPPKKKTTKKPAAKTAPVDVEAIATDVLDRVRITDNQLGRIFGVAELDEEQKLHAANIRKAGAAFAQIIVNETRNGPDRQAAIRKVREATMTAIAGVSHNT